MIHILMVPPGGSGHFLATILDMMLSQTCSDYSITSEASCHDNDWRTAANLSKIPFAPKMNIYFNSEVDETKEHFVYFHAKKQDVEKNAEFLIERKHLYVYIDDETSARVCAERFYKKRVVPLYDTKESTRKRIVGCYFDYDMPRTIAELSENEIAHFIDCFSLELLTRYAKTDYDINQISFDDIMQDPVNNLMKLFEINNISQDSIKRMNEFVHDYERQQTT